MQVYRLIGNSVVSTITQSPDKYSITADQFNFVFNKRENNMLELAESIIDANSEINNDKDYTDILSLLNTIPVPLKGTETSPEFSKYTNPAGDIQSKPATSPDSKPVGDLPDDYEY